MNLVVGATGTLGGRITRGLLAAGEEVRILVRQDSPSTELAQIELATPAEALIKAGAQPVLGDLRDAASLEAACAGVNTVFTTATATKREATDTIEAVDLQGTLSLIDAARHQGVGRFVYTSVYGSEFEHPNPLYHIKATCEARLAESGMAYVILQPNFFMEVWVGMIVGIPLQAGQPITLVGKGDHCHAFVAEADVADFALAVRNDPAATGTRLVIGGPAAHSWTEVVEIVGEAMGRALPINYVTPGSEIPLVPTLAGALLAGTETYESPIDMEETAARYGVELTSLKEFAQATFGEPMQTG